MEKAGKPAGDGDKPLNLDRPCPLEYIQITGLHGDQNLTMHFSGAYTVYVAENGSGKTTALYTLQYILRREFEKLRKINFSHINMKFFDSDELSIPRSAFATDRRLDEWMRKFFGPMGLEGEMASDLMSRVAHGDIRLVMDHPYFRRLSVQSGIGMRTAYERLRRIYLERYSGELPLNDPDADLMKALGEKMRKYFPFKVMYLPTYRRVEQDLKTVLNLDAPPKEFSPFVHFGMGDVELRIEEVADKIGKHLVRSYGQISGQMLDHLATNIDITPDIISALSSEDDITIVLNRLGENISQKARESILDKAKNDELTDNPPLAFLIAKLIEAYGAVRTLDEASQDFANVCNKYLVNKEFRYDPVNGTVRLYSKISNKPLDLDGLSSGEKQLVGVMSEIYLSEQDKYAIIFDEPELSLSVEWQKRILPDLVRSGRCEFMVAATHSPFIFDNAFDAYARPLISEYQLLPDLS